MKQSRTVITTALVLLAGMASIAAVSAFDTRPLAVREMALVNGLEVPVTLSTFEAVGPDARRLLFRRLAPRERSRLWQEHLRQFVEGSTLSDEQVAFVEDYASYLTPEAYAAEGAVDPAFLDLCADVPKLFDETQRITFGLLGSFDPKAFAERMRREDSGLRAVAKWVQDTLDLSTVYADEFDDCSCLLDTWCSLCNAIPLHECEDEDCEDSWPGCGCGGIFTCKEVCNTIIE